MFVVIVAHVPILAQAGWVALAGARGFLAGVVLPAFYDHIAMIWHDLDGVADAAGDLGGH